MNLLLPIDNAYNIVYTKKDIVLLSKTKTHGQRLLPSLLEWLIKMELFEGMQ